VPDRFEDQVRAALAVAEDETVPPVERAEMLMEIAVGLQQRPKSAAQLQSAIRLYDQALAVCPGSELLLATRIRMRRATALQAMSEGTTAALEAARAAYEDALPILREHGQTEEVAEVEMNLGVVLQELAAERRAPITSAISAYQRALRTFNRERFPKEFGILQNNLATAFLSMPFTDERGRMREALAVAAFEEGLKVVTLVDHPAEYAMLQNNLGNALQYVSSSHAVANNLRALDAYDEALRVRRPDTMPVEYANTVANKANCLWNLPDDPEHPEAGNGGRMRAARELYVEARAIFTQHQQPDKARVVGEALAAIERELLALADGSGAAP
jgi:tetratricopeptide (TPR) repeat protein